MDILLSEQVADPENVRENFKKIRSYVNKGNITDIFPGSGINIDKTDPANPIINAVNAATGKYIISGGAVWSGTGLTYNTSYIPFFWNGNKLASPTSLTLAASDATNNRLDVIVVDEAGNVTVITGTASASPITPAIPEDQLLVQFILVEAGTTVPNVTQENIYLNNAEWTFANYTTSGTQVGTSNPNATNSPKEGTKCIDNSLDPRTGIRFARATSLDITPYTTFAMWIRIPSAIDPKETLLARFENTSFAPIGNQVDLFSYGIQKTVLGTWQLAIVPVSAFGVTAVQGFRLIMTGGKTGLQVLWDADFITLTDGSTPVIVSPEINFYKDSVKIASQKGLDVVAGTGIGITAVEDPVKETVKYTFTPDTNKAYVDAADAVLQSNIDLKLDISAYNDRYKGKYTTLTALQTAFPTANAGDYAQVDAGAGHDVINYSYDTDDGWIEGGSGSGATNTDALPEGSTNLYFTTARVLATLLTGLSVLTGGDIVSTDSILVAFGKIQKRFNDLLTTFNGANQLVKLDGSSTPKLPAVDGSLLLNLPSSGVGTWGSITGTLSAQTDLQTALNAKAANLLTGYVKGSGVVASTDSVLQAIQKLDGNDDVLQGEINAVNPVGNKLFNYYNFI